MKGEKKLKTVGYLSPFLIILFGLGLALADTIIVWFFPVWFTVLTGRLFIFECADLASEAFGK